MSENVHKQTSLKDISQSMKSGEEPTELLLALAWSAIETLQKRGAIRLFVGNGAVAVFFHNTDLVPHLGLVPTDSKSVGSKELQVKT